MRKKYNNKVLLFCKTTKIDKGIFLPESFRKLCKFRAGESAFIPLWGISESPALIPPRQVLQSHPQLHTLYTKEMQ